MSGAWGLLRVWGALHALDRFRWFRLVFAVFAVVSVLLWTLPGGQLTTFVSLAWVGLMLGSLWSGLLGPAPRIGGGVLAPMLPVRRVDRAIAATAPPLLAIGALTGLLLLVGRGVPGAAMAAGAGAAVAGSLVGVPTFGRSGPLEAMLPLGASRPEVAVMLTAVERSFRPALLVVVLAVLVGLVSDGSRSGWFVIMSTLMTVVSCLPLFLVGEGKDAPLLPVRQTTVRGGVIAVATMWALLTGLGDLLAGRVPGWRWLLGRLLFGVGGAALFVRLDGPLVWGGWMVVVALVGGAATLGEVDLLSTPVLGIGAVVAAGAVWRAVRE